MKKRMTLALLLLTGCFQVQAQTGLPAFPGAEGFGKYVTGGRGGTVCRVTSLADSGPGTLRQALEQEGTRTVVFDVAGTIHLETPIRIRHGNLTLAGQTSPGGICVADQPISLGAENVIVRYMTFRPGDKYQGEPDGFGGSGGRNLIVDHCSVSWSVDECFTIYGVENATSQWCLIAQPLRESTHVKGAHGYGAIWGGVKSSYLNNLIAHAESRVPRLGPHASTQTREWLDIRNNVFYNWAGGGCYGGEGQKANIVNNYYKPGPATLATPGAIQYRITAIGVRTTAYCQNARGEWNAWAPMHHVWGKFYIDGNVMEGNPEVTRDNWTKGVYEQTRNNEGVDFLWTETTRDTVRLSEPLDFGEVRTRSAEEAYASVLKYVGNSLYRDALDETMLQDVRLGTATYTAAGAKPGFINTPADAGGLPVISTDASRAGAADSDGDGMPDAWERSQGLNPADSADGRTSTLSAEGYTNLEMYLNGLVQAITAGQAE
jgi:hypothetical protein